jgi:polar amino acid transport system substrate-binding protein
MLFSRASLSASEAAAFDGALAQLDREGRVRAVAQRFANVLSLSIAFRSDLIDLCFIVGIVAFSISGVVIARTGNYSIFGALVLASLPALGGGVVRDLILLRDIYFFESPVMIYACLLTIAAGYLFNRLLDLVRGRALWFFDVVNFVLYLRRRISPQLTMQVFDAAGLALFTIVSVSIAAEEDLAPLWFWGPIVAAITATGGAILRDMIRKDALNPMLHTAFYGEAVVIWSFAYSLFLQYLGPYASPNALLAVSLVSMLGIFATRLLFTVTRWRSPRY